MSAKKAKGPRGVKPYRQKILEARGLKPLSPHLLSRMWRVPVYAIEEWFAKEPGLIRWKRKNKWGLIVPVWRAPFEVAERVRERHGIKVGVAAGGKAVEKALREASA